MPCCLVAASNIYNIPIGIISSQASGLQNITPYAHNPTEINRPMIYLGHQHEVHYIRLEPLTEAFHSGDDIDNGDCDNLLIENSDNGQKPNHDDGSGVSIDLNNNTGNADDDDFDGLQNLQGTTWCLPPEILIYIMTLCAQSDISSVQRLKCVCKAFRFCMDKSTQCINKPNIHISPSVSHTLRLSHTLTSLNIVSVKKLINVCGTHSGLILRIHGFLQNVRWHTAWLVLKRAIEIDYYQITRVFWKKK
jgi:hypothetical protein